MIAPSLTGFNEAAGIPRGRRTARKPVAIQGGSPLDRERSRDREGRAVADAMGLTMGGL